MLFLISSQSSLYISKRFNFNKSCRKSTTTYSEIALLLTHVRGVSCLLKRILIPKGQHPWRVTIPGQDKKTTVFFSFSALLSFYERHHSTWRSEPQLTPGLTPAQPSGQCANSPSAHSVSSQAVLSQYLTARGGGAPRRSSSASDYAGGHWKEVSGKLFYICDCDNL